MTVQGPALSIAGLALLSCGCEQPEGTEEQFPEGAPQALAFETEHFRYFADEPVCDSLGQRMEQEYEAGRSFLGIDGSDDVEVRYFYYGEWADVSPPCSSEHAIGCYLPPRDIIAGAWFSRHEAMHAYADDLGSPPSFFMECLAEMAAPDGTDADILVEHESDPTSMIVGDEFIDYSVAASFCRHLIDQTNMEAFLGFYADAPSDASTAQFGEVFQRAFGRTLSEEVEAWMASPPDARGEAYVWLTECSSEELSVEDGQSIRLTPDLTCDQVPLDQDREPGQVGAYRTLLVEDSDSALHLTLESPISAGVVVGGCEGFYGTRQVWLGGASSGRRVELWTTVDEGSHFLSIRQAGDGTTSNATTVSVEKTGYPGDEVCSRAGEVSLSSDIALTRFDTRTDSGDFFVWLEAEEAQTIRFDDNTSLLDSESDGARTAALCTGDCEALECAYCAGWGCDEAPWYSPSDSDDPSFVLFEGQRVLLHVEFPEASRLQFDLVSDE